MNLSGLGLLCRNIKYSHILYYLVANISPVFIRAYILLLVRIFLLLDCYNCHLWSALHWKIKQLSPFLCVPSRMLVKITTNAIFWHVNMCNIPKWLGWSSFHSQSPLFWKDLLPPHLNKLYILKMSYSFRSQ